MRLVIPILVLFIWFGAYDCGVLSAGPYPKDFVSGVDRVRLGMTEEQVSTVLRSQPIRRKETERLVEALWEIADPLPGQALGRFLGGPLVSIEFVPKTLTSPPSPSITPEIAKMLTAYSIVQKAFAHTLTMAELHTIAGVPPQRHRWKMYGTSRNANTMSRWAWAIVPGARYVIVDETDDHAGQPFIRP